MSSLIWHFPLVSLGAPHNPQIPDAGLNFNDDSFTSKEIAITRYEPVCWTLFGGPAGTYLKSLTGVSVTVDGDTIGGIEFHYNSEDVPSECRKVGKCTPTDYAKTMHFEIDGPNGEVIDSLTVGVYQYANESAVWFLKPGVLESFKARPLHSALIRPNV